MLRHLRRGCPGGGESLTGFSVQGEADAAGQVFVRGVADQVVAESQPGAVVGQHTGGDGLVSATDRLSAGRAVLTDNSVRVKLDPRIEAARRACRVSSGRKLSRRRMVSRSVGGSVISTTSARPFEVLQGPFLPDGAEQLGHEKRVAARPCDLSQQAGSRFGVDRLGDELGHRLIAEPSNGQVTTRRPRCSESITRCNCGTCGEGR